jgi:hypothetical protein
MTTPTPVPIVLPLELPVGSRLLVVGELLLRRQPTPSSDVADAELAEALSGWDGPGALVLNGDMLDLLPPNTSPAGILGGHARLTAAIAAFAERPDRAVICLPGPHDRRLLSDPAARDELAQLIGAKVANRVEVCVTTGEGIRRVLVEPGHRFDTRFALGDDDPRDSPLGIRVLDELLPSLAGPWAVGVDRLADIAPLPQFVASRILYRRLAPWAWLLLVPFVAALAVQLGLSYATDQRRGPLTGAWVHRLEVLGAVTAIDVVVVAAVLAALLSAAWRVVGGGARGIGPTTPLGHRRGSSSPRVAPGWSSATAAPLS